MLKNQTKFKPLRLKSITTNIKESNKFKPLGLEATKYQIQNKRIFLIVSTF